MSAGRGVSWMVFSFLRLYDQPLTANTGENNINTGECECRDFILSAIHVLVKERHGVGINLVVKEWLRMVARGGRKLLLVGDGVGMVCSVLACCWNTPLPVLWRLRWGIMRVLGW